MPDKSGLNISLYNDKKLKKKADTHFHHHFSHYRKSFSETNAYRAARDSIVNDLMTLIKVIDGLTPTFLNDLNSTWPHVSNKKESILADIMSVYYSARISQIKTSLVGHNNEIQKQLKCAKGKPSALITNFGLCSTAGGVHAETAKTYQPKTSKKINKKKGINRFSAVNQYLSAGLFSCKNWSPLLNICWLIGCIDAQHDIYLLGNSSHWQSYIDVNYLYENNRIRVCALELVVLISAGYKVVSNQHGLPPGLKPPEKPIVSCELEEVKARFYAMLFSQVHKTVNEIKEKPLSVPQLLKSEPSAAMRCTIL